MSDNSLESLLQWMAASDSNVLWGWDCIAVMARNKTNLLLAQAYIGRFDTGSYLPPISGKVPMVEGQFEQHIHDFLLDVPLLSFENASLDNSRARLAMSVMGGVQVAMDREGAAWRVVAIHDIDPLQGPKLYLELLLDKVPGTVGVDGAVKLDLKDSDNFILTFAATEHERRLGGDFFKDLFNTLPPQKRVFVLGSILPGSDPALRPQSFKLRTQSKSVQSRDPLSADFGDGAVLILLRMTGGTEGAIPGASLRYLIPDDAGKDYSATVVLKRQRVTSLLTLVENVMARAQEAFQGLTFTIRAGADGILESAVASGGKIHFDPVWRGLGPFIQGNALVYVRLFYSGLSYPANSRVPFSITLDRQTLQVRVRWECESSTTRIDDYMGRRGQGYERKITERDYTVKLDITYAIRGAENDLVLVPEQFDIDERYTERQSTEWKYGDVDFDESNPLPYWQLAGQVLEFASVVSQQVSKPRLEAKLRPQFSLPFSLGAFIRDSIQLNFAQAIVTDELHIPHDVGSFGRVNPLATSFVIEPLHALLGAGDSLQFQVPANVTGLSWSVEALDGTGDPGSVSASGVYRAPAATAFQGRFTRVRVIASRSGYHSAALVSVVRNALTVNPLISLCHIGESCELAAGSLGEGDLEWSVLNPQPQYAGSVVPSVDPDGDHTYYPVATDDKPRAQTYLVDEVKVRNRHSGQSLSVHVLVTLYRPELSVRLLESDLPVHQARLQVYAYGDPFDEVRWYLPLGGPGTIDQNGVYTADESTLQRFVLIIAEALEFPDAAGHIILPLPLAAFPAERALLAQAQPEATGQQVTSLADTSLNGLLQWMAAAGTEVLHGWDAIVAMDRSKTNLLLSQAYVAGYASDSRMPPMSGEVELVGGRFKEVLQDVILGVPRLSFEPTGLDNSKARLNLALVGGLEVSMKKNGDVWQAWKVSEMQPLQGPQLYLDLQLDRVPGVVGEQGRVALDLRHSDNFHLSFAESVEDQQRGGELFRQLFNALPDEQRVLVLGFIEPGAQPGLQARTFRLQTQRKDTGGAEGSILITLGMTEDRPGQALPASLPWLIPTDAGHDWSASLLLKRRRVLEGSVMHMLAGLIGGGHFSLERDANGDLLRASSTGGALIVPPVEFDIPLGTGSSAVVLTARMGELSIAAIAAQPLQVSFEGEQAHIVWQAAGEMDCTLILGETSEPLRQRCRVWLEARYELDAQNMQLHRTFWDFKALVDSPPASSSAAPQADTSDLGKIIMYWLLIMATIGTVYPTRAVGAKVNERMQEALGAEMVIDDFIHQTIRLNFANALDADTLRLPRDLLALGRVSPLLSGFTLSPSLPTMLAGNKLQLRTEPAHQVQHWSAQTVGEVAHPPGSVDRNGLYSAPPASAFEGSFTEIRVTATDAAGQLAATLVKVMRSEVSVAPLIQECEAGAAVRLQAATPGSGTLNWSVRSRVDAPCGSLAAGSGECTYTAPSATDANNRYLVDEVAVRLGNGAAALSYVVVPTQGSTLSIRPAAEPPASSGRVQLQAFSSDTPLDNAQWHLPLGGPGSIDATGLYSAPTAGSERFVLIMAKATRLNRTVEGHLILPLPL